MSKPNTGVSCEVYTTEAGVKCPMCGEAVAPNVRHSCGTGATVAGGLVGWADSYGRIPKTCKQCGAAQSIVALFLQTGHVRVTYGCLHVVLVSPDPGWVKQ